MQLLDWRVGIASAYVLLRASITLHTEKETLMPLSLAVSLVLMFVPVILAAVRG